MKENNKQKKRLDVESEKEKSRRVYKYLIDREGSSIRQGDIVDEIDGVERYHVKRKSADSRPFLFYKVSTLQRSDGLYYYAEKDTALMLFSVLMMLGTLSIVAYSLMAGV